MGIQEVTATRESDSDSSEDASNYRYDCSQKEIDTMDWESPALGLAFPAAVIDSVTVFVDCSAR